MKTSHIHLKKNSDIEALRALAIVLVILAHVSALLSPDSLYRAILTHFRFGYGVDIFFCISGYIITKSIIKEIPRDKTFKSFINFAAPFWVRRFWRLMPSALFWVCMALLLSAICGGKGYIPELKVFVWSALAAAFQYLNVIYPACRDAGACGTVGVYWSLSLENQFYFVLPVIAVLTGKRWMPMVFAAIFISQFFISRQLVDPTPGLWAFRTDAISLGVLLALWQSHSSYSRLEPNILRNGALTSIFLIAIVIALAAMTVPSPPIPFAMGLTAVGSALLVWAASYNKSYFTKNKFIATACNYIGSRSYAIYLTHFIVIFAVRHFYFSAPGSQTTTPYDSLSTFMYVATFLILTLALSEFNYRFIETPFRNRGEKISTGIREKLSQPS